MPILLKKFFFRIFLPLSVIAGTVTWMYYRPHIYENVLTKVMTTCWALISLSLIIIVIFLIDSFLNRILPWKTKTGLRFFTQLFIGGFACLACFNAAYYGVKLYYTQSSPDLGQYVVMNMYGSAIVLPMISIYFGYQFLKDWRKSELETERLQKENMSSQMMALKNHLDPHFLFNNLNILSSIMDKDVELAKSYLDKFAEVYRTILKSEQSDLTTLEEEMKMVDSYIYLINLRFGQSLNFILNIDPALMDKALPPLSIQMLIENIIKHNMATAEQPVTISIRTENDDTLVVANNIQPKKYSVNETSGSGLQNIKDRYSFFSDNKVIVEDHSGEFKVSLPLLEITY